MKAPTIALRLTGKEKRILARLEDMGGIPAVNLIRTVIWDVLGGIARGGDEGLLDDYRKDYIERQLNPLRR